MNQAQADQDMAHQVSEEDDSVEDRIKYRPVWL